MSENYSGEGSVESLRHTIRNMIRLAEGTKNEEKFVSAVRSVCTEFSDTAKQAARVAGGEGDNLRQRAEKFLKEMHPNQDTPELRLWIAMLESALREVEQKTAEECAEIVQYPETSVRRIELAREIRARFGLEPK